MLECLIHHSPEIAFAILVIVSIRAAYLCSKYIGTKYGES